MKQPRILIIRRDNIGDLVCTTPLIAGLRQHYPKAWIGMLANSYNAPVLEGNHDIDAIYAYRKTKHGGTNVWSSVWERVRMIYALRLQALDYAMVATPAHRDRGLRIARLVGAKKTVAFTRRGSAVRGVDIAVSLDESECASEVELVWRLAAPLGLTGTPPAMKVVAPADIAARVQATIDERRWNARGPLIGIHLSARKPSQRWPARSFIALMRALHEREDARFLLFWAPGEAAQPQHPGDDAKAAEVIAGTRELPVIPYATVQLRELIGAMAVCNRMILSDGGAMHIAAALGKPLLAFFGQSDPVRWRPWGVPHELLQARTCNVEDISVEEALASYDRLVARVQAP